MAQILQETRSPLLSARRQGKINLDASPVVEDLEGIEGRFRLVLINRQNIDDLTHAEHEILTHAEHEMTHENTQKFRLVPIELTPATVLATEGAQIEKKDFPTRKAGPRTTDAGRPHLTQSL
jgi:hypothetical protein